jgi:uncharacterized protein (TIGR03000 family)
MYSLILLCAAATSAEPAACPAVMHCPLAVYSTTLRQEEGDPEAKVYPETEADKLMLKEMMGWVTDPAERKKVLAYWTSPGVGPEARAEFYFELRQKAGVDDAEEEAVSSEDAPCTIAVKLPEDARLFIQGDLTTSTGPERTFVSPKLTGGQTYLYTLTALMERDGEVVSVTRTVRVWAGSKAEVTIE